MKGHRLLSRLGISLLDSLKNVFMHFIVLTVIGNFVGPDPPVRHHG